MTPEQKIKWSIINKVCSWKGSEPPEVNDENVNEIWDEMRHETHEDECYDAMCEIREGDVETNINPECSRYYESKSVAALMPDNTWVGWTYWYGGGKHACPEEVCWIDSSYDLNCVEYEKTVTIKEFPKVKD